jgi:hypothetical protein
MAEPENILSAAPFVGDLLALTADPATIAARLSRLVELEGRKAELETARAEKRAKIDGHMAIVTAELKRGTATVEGRRERIEQQLGRIEDIEETLLKDENNWRGILPTGEAPYAFALRQELRALQ